MGILDLLFPKKCVVCKKIGSYLCDNCFSYLSFDTKNICPKGLEGLFSSITYNKTAQKLIYNFKYKPYLTDLRKVLSDLFYEGLIQKEDFISEITHNAWIIVPVPLYKTRLKKRGYNQAEILAKDLAKRFNLPIQNILIRVKNTKPQFGLNKHQRKENIRKAFLLKSSIINLKSINVFLVDDLATTGTTLVEAAKVLKRNGVKKVISLTLARD